MPPLVDSVAALPSVLRREAQAQQDVDADAKGIGIHLEGIVGVLGVVPVHDAVEGVPSAESDLRRSVGLGAHRRARRGPCCRKHLRETEVRYLHGEDLVHSPRRGSGAWAAHLGHPNVDVGDEHILELEVPMHNTLAVAERDGVDELCGDVRRGGLVEGPGALCQCVAEGAAGDELGDDVDLLGGLTAECALQRHDAWMTTQSAKSINFARDQDLRDALLRKVLGVVAIGQAVAARSDRADAEDLDGENLFVTCAEAAEHRAVGALAQQLLFEVPLAGPAKHRHILESS
mmetsp:Transcript_44188/g.124802  ORF Transcript_44188/g.124802 Transcript_44188/m.124802 type:complete len:289 (+) Transcript_44188:1523-2389(+)